MSVFLIPMWVALGLRLRRNETPKSPARWGYWLNMIRTLLRTNVLVATSAVSAFAADVTSPPPPTTPMFAPYPVRDWRSIGGNAGSPWSNGGNRTISDAIFSAQIVSLGSGFVADSRVSSYFRFGEFVGRVATRPTNRSSFGALAPIIAPKAMSGTAILAKPLARLGADRQTREALLGPNGPLSVNATGRNLVDIGIVVQGVNDEMLDEAPAPGEATVSGPIQSYPLSATALADQRARAARYGAGSTMENLASSDADLAPTSIATLSPGRRPRAFDASEGTPLDPLLNKTYDLNYAKAVPSLQ
jgi:hypothetical protein